MALVLPQLWMALAAPSSPGPGNLLAPAATDDGWDGEVIRPAEIDSVAVFIRQERGRHCRIVFSSSLLTIHQRITESSCAYPENGG